MAPESGAGGGVPDAAAESWGVGGVVGDGRYRLTHRLGRGGMAEVFAAEDVRLGRTVAVKLLRADLAEDPVSKARFTREAQSVAGLNHHAIVAVYDSGEDLVGGRPVPYIVMELVEGRTIRDLLLSAEAPGPEQALIIVSGVLEALAYSHQHGIVHRDIKPANVIITHSGAVKVMDFGIARALHGAQSTMTQTGMVMGTPQYLSPEQALGKAVDHRSDLYATGCLLYELLALRPPFTGETPLSVVYQHVQDTPVPPSEVTHAVPPELDGLVMRSLAKDPDDRFQSAEEMRGLIQYGLQMLQQQGGHTGTWNTGPVGLHDGVHTQVNGMAATTAMGHPMHGETAQGPILPPMNPDDGGYGGYDGGPVAAGGYGQDVGYQQGRGRAGRGKVWLFAALALIAVVVGIVFALDPPGRTDDSPGNTPTVTDAPTTASEEPTPSEEPSQEPTRDQGNSDGGATQQPWTPPRTHRPTTQPAPTEETTGEPVTEPTPSEEPTEEPTKTTAPPTEPTGEPTTEAPPTSTVNPETPPTGGGAPTG
ncbi:MULTISPECIES: protein kinase domain-containing protein [unclassified Streptomyces]|uniref:protein kinase domain-containing protein n=1 Tax=unclassified Streptomyces TaxID=2593676 RepID=UPI00166164B3|nr:MULTISPECIES: protein kinase [unclassified Streptomyces]MBD0708378.1 serine/threonine protein kinase [Streptomyces sp. CBMA291]MBD0708941.1 serine/threonine protein kinase [Streptomyces sp. CBMA291]MBD0713068.1 serine/threonine protein kinase [Streptomyces sp. CBMA370]